jgi:hypothetical protein
MQRETKFKLRVQKDLDKLPNTYFVKIQQVSIRGIPDFFCCIDGKFIALELKCDEKAKRHKLQEWTLQSISHAGGMSYICYPDNWDDTYAVLAHLSGAEHEDQEESYETSH